MKKRLEINGLIIVLALMLIMIFPAWFFRNGGIVYYDEVSEIFGVAFILLGQLFRASARGYKAEHSRQGESLIQGGPYALVRNPMYLGILLIGLGIVLMLFKWWVAGVFLAVFILRYVWLVFKEEDKLLRFFPKEYPRYKSCVPRLLPSPAALLHRDVREYLPLKLSWLKKEIGTILAVLLLTLLLESWKDIKNEGLKIYLQETAGMFLVIVLFICLAWYLGRRTGASKENVSAKG
jgi:protein-S-isoprenylcysteine O-methyltransferase Ste14